MRKLLFWLSTGCLLAAAIGVRAQQAVRPTRADVIPEAYGHSADSLAYYIDAHFDGDREKAEAIYAWITTRLTYNVYTTFTSRNEVYSETRDIQRALDSRKGICRQFALLFRTVAERVGIPAFVVSGYNKVQGVLLGTPHDWCAALVDGQWLLYDPTFGMGYIANNQFVHAPTMSYCHLRPEALIGSHMPYDPIWQLLEVPYSYDEFDNNRKPAANRNHPFHFKDSIQAYVRQPRMEQLKAIYGRIKRNGTPNQLVDYYLQLTEANISVHEQRKVYDVYKEAVKMQNRSVDLLNAFLRYRNRGFTPSKEEQEVRMQLTEVRQSIRATDSLLQTLTVIPPVYQSALTNLQASVASVTSRLDVQQAFVDEYYAAPASKRKKMLSDGRKR